MGTRVRHLCLVRDHERKGPARVSAARWPFVVSPPRDRPKAWSGGSPARPPFRRAPAARWGHARSWNRPRRPSRGPAGDHATAHPGETSDRARVLPWHAPPNSTIRDEPERPTRALSAGVLALPTTRAVSLAPLSTAGILLLSACDATGGPSGGAARTTPLRVRSGGRSRSLVGRSQVLRWPGGSGLRSQLRVPPHTRATRVNHGGHPGLSEIAARLRVLSVHTSHHVQDLTQMGGQLEEALAAPPHPLP